jgi:hypothetical protein
MENSSLVKLSQDELLEIKNLQVSEKSLVMQFGQLEYRIQSLELQKEQLIENISNLKQQEADIANKLQEKYGDGTINLETGTFTKQD